jgi:uncharacterized protein (DUF433 family)
MTAPKSAGDEFVQKLFDGPFIEVNSLCVGGAPALAGRRFTLSQLVAEIAEDSLMRVCEDFDLDRDEVVGALNQLARALLFQARKNEQGYNVGQSGG